jgi:hypothetical protein
MVDTDGRSAAPGLGVDVDSGSGKKGAIGENNVDLVAIDDSDVFYS